MHAISYPLYHRRLPFNIYRLLPHPSHEPKCDCPATSGNLPCLGNYIPDIPDAPGTNGGGPVAHFTSGMVMASPDDLKAGLDCYDPEHRVFPHLSKPHEGQRLTPQDVLLILKWKLGRIRSIHSKTVNEKNMACINQAVQNAAISENRNLALKTLASLPGIRLAAATAILTVCYPNDFTIIDQRVLGQLGLGPATTDRWTVDEYLKRYLPAVRERAKGWGCTLRDADRALWGLSVRKQMADIINSSRTTNGESASGV